MRVYVANCFKKLVRLEQDRTEVNFDLVWKVLREIQRVCRPAGILGFVIPHEV